MSLLFPEIGVGEPTSIPKSTLPNRTFFFQKSRLIREYGTRLSEERDFRVGEGNGLCLEKKGFERVFPENGELMFKSPEAMENRQILQPGRFRSQMRMTVRRT